MKRKEPIDKNSKPSEFINARAQPERDVAAPLPTPKSFCQYLPASRRKKQAIRKQNSKPQTTKPAPAATNKKGFITAFAPVPVKSTNRETPRSRGSSGSESNNRKIQISADEYDICHIDEKIRSVLGSKISTLPELQSDLMNLLWIMGNSSDPLDRIQAKNQTNILRRRIQDIECGFELGLYILRTADILNEYRAIMASTKSRSFMRAERYTNDNAVIRKNMIILDYLRIARDYIDLENFTQRPQKLICEACFGVEFTCSDDDAIYVCKKCGLSVELMDDSPSFKDTDRVNMSSRYTYTCRGHFVAAMDRFEGKQNTEIDPKVINILKEEMKKHSLLEKTVTKDHVYMFMSEKQLSDYYEDLNLIFFQITGQPCPDITELRSELLEMFDQEEEAYKEVKDDDRINSLNVNFKLFKLLQLLDYSCKKDDFYFLKTPTKQGEHDDKWQETIEYLAQKYPDAKTSAGKKRWRYIRTI